LDKKNIGFAGLNLIASFDEKPDSRNPSGYAYAEAGYAVKKPRIAGKKGP
jgi:hypothetical protein